MSAIVEFDDTLLAVWYIQISTTSNMLSSVSQLPDGKFQMMTRFRYYRDKQAFDSEDEKSGYQVVSAKPDALDTFRGLMHEMRARTGGVMFELLRESRTTEEMFAVFESWPVVHKRMEANE